MIIGLLSTCSTAFHLLSSFTYLSSSAPRLVFTHPNSSSAVVITMSSMTNPDPGYSHRNGEPQASDSDDSKSPSSDLLGDILRAAEEAVSAPIQQLAPDYRSETYSIASRQRSVRSLRKKSIPIEDQRHPGKPGARISRTTRNIDEVLELESERDANKEREHSQDSSITIQEADDAEYPGPVPLAILLISICLVVFLVSLDRTIITTVCKMLFFFLSYVVHS